jgi:heme A synthase
MPLVIQVTHRIIAFLLFGHLWGIAAAVGKRNEPRIIVTIARIAFFSAVAQILVAAAMIEMHFPAVFRSLHQALGTFVWLAVVSLAIVSARAAREIEFRSGVRAAA